MSKLVLVTGGTGFIGSALVKQLLMLGYRVRVLDNNQRGQPSRLGDFLHDIEYLQGDILDTKVVHDAVHNVDVVFHLAFINGTRYFYEMPEKVLEVGLKGTLNVLDAIKYHQVPRYIYASSSEVYQQPTVVPTPEHERLCIPDPREPRYSYAGAKLAGELLAFHYLNHTNTEAMVFRPHNIYGPDMGQEHVIPELLLKIKSRLVDGTEEIDLPIQGQGDATRAFCYIDDAVSAISMLASQGEAGEIYHIGVDEEITILSLVQKLAEVVGVKINVLADASPTGGTSRRCPSIEKMIKLGFKPKYTLEQGLLVTKQWYFEEFK